MMEYFFLINAMLLEGNGLEKTLKKLKFKNVLLPSKPLIRFARQVVISTCDNYFILRQTMSCKAIRIPISGKFLLVDSGIRNNFACTIRNPELWNLEYKDWRESSTWNPKSKPRNPESKTVLDSLTWGHHPAWLSCQGHINIYMYTIVSPKTRHYQLTKHLATFRFGLLSQ